MIRLIQRRLIIPRGDTGTFSIPALSGKNSGDVSIFTIFDPLIRKKVFEKQMTLNDGVLSMSFSHGDTVNLPVGHYVWDIKFYTNPQFADGQLISGEEIDSYYAAFTLPVCEIRQTGDNLLMSDDAPQATLAPDQIDLITAVLQEITGAKDVAVASRDSAIDSAREAETSATQAEAYASDALGYKNDTLAAKDEALQAAIDATTQATNAAQSAANALQSANDADASATAANAAKEAAIAAQNTTIAAKDIAVQAEADASAHKTSASNSATLAANSANAAGLSEQNAEDYANAAALSEANAKSSETNAAGSAVAAAASAQQAQATAQAIHEEIPTKVSELDNDAGYLQVETDPTVPAWAKAQTKPSYTAQEVGALPADTYIPNKTSDLTNDSNYPVDANYVHTDNNYTTEEKNKLGGIAAGAEVNVNADWNAVDGDAFILNKPTKVSDFQNDTGFITSAALPTKVSDLIDDSGHYTKPVGGIPASDLEETYLTSFTETDPTVPAWAKAVQKPSYTAAEVGAPTVQEMNTAIGTAIGNINSFDMSVVQSLPTQDISTHTIYLVPKTGETNDVYDEYVYINSAWEMVGNTQIDLSNYVQKTDYATNSTAGVIKVPSDAGLGMLMGEYLIIAQASNERIKNSTNMPAPITTGNQHTSVFYALAKAAGDTTQSQSNNTVGTYTTEAKAAIQTMLDVPSNADLALKADKTDTVLETTLSRGRKDNTTVGGASLAFGIDTEASGYYSVALGLNTTASSQGAFAEGKNTVARYIAHAEGENSQALSSWSHAQNVNTIANGGASSASGRSTIANGADSFVFGRYNAADSYDNWPTWTANTSYEVGDRVKRNLMVQNQPTDVGYHCTVANSDATFDNAHWELDGYHMNYVEIVGNGKEYEDPETHQTIRAGSNAYALEWNGTARYMGDVYVGANADSSGGTKVLCEADFATDLDIQNIINGGAGA